jgi:hypothetical protein
VTKERVLGAVRVVGAGLILAAVIAQLSRQVDRHASVVNFFSFFTIQSNLFAAVILAITGVVSVRGQSIERYAMVRGAATTYMVTVGITYTLLLRGLEDSLNTTLPWVNTVLHYLMPLVLFVDWAVDPPRRGIDVRGALWWLVFPLAYSVYSLVRGPFANFYPYPFINVDLHGYPRVLLTCVILAVAIAAIASAVTWYSRRRAPTGWKRLIPPRWR